MNLLLKGTALFGLVSVASVSNALDITTLNGTQGAPGAVSTTSTGWISYGANTTAGNANIVSGNGDGYLRLQGDRIRAGVGVFEGSNASQGSVPSFGTLGQLAAGTMFADLFRSSLSQTNDARYNVAIKLSFANNQSLTWENGNNGGDLTQDAFVTRNLGTGNWFIRTGNVNYDTPTNNHTLTEWAAGAKLVGQEANPAPLSADSQVTGVLFAVGSGISSGPNSFIGGVDNLRMNFSGGNAYAYNFQAVPEPASMAVLALGGLGLLRRRKRA